MDPQYGGGGGAPPLVPQRPAAYVHGPGLPPRPDSSHRPPPQPPRPCTCLVSLPCLRCVWSLMVTSLYNTLILELRYQLLECRRSLLTLGMVGATAAQPAQPPLPARPTSTHGPMPPVPQQPALPPRAPQQSAHAAYGREHSGEYAPGFDDGRPAHEAAVPGLPPRQQPGLPLGTQSYGAQGSPMPALPPPPGRRPSFAMDSLHQTLPQTYQGALESGGSTVCPRLWSR